MSTTVTPEPAAPATPASPAPAPPSPTPAVGTTAPNGQAAFDANAVLEELIESKGGGFQGARLAALKLMRDKGKLLERISRLRDRVVEEGAVVLRGDALVTHNKLTALGLSPDQISQKMSEHAVLQAEVKASKQDRFFEDVADRMGYSGSGKKVFTKLAKMHGLEIEDRDVDVQQTDGTTTKEKRPFARLATDTKGDFKPLETYVDEEFGEFRPALFAGEGDADDDAPHRTADSRPSGGHAPERKVTPMATQGGSSRTSEANAERGAVQRVLNNRYAPRKTAT